MHLDKQIQDVYANSKSYPELVKGLIALGMNSYTVEVSSGTTLYRFSDGVTELHAGKDLRTITDDFDKAATIHAVKETQAGRLPYPQFMEAIAKSGVRFYEATINGPNKRVCYIGRGGFFEEAIPS